MKIARYTASVLLLLITGYVKAQPSGAGDPWTLEACLEFALENNEQIKIAEASQKIADARVGQTRAQGLPQVNGGMNYTFNPAIQQQVVQDFLSPAVGGVLLGLGEISPQQFGAIQAGADTTFFGLGFGTRHSALASVQVSQLLFDGSYFVGLRAARTYRELAAYEANRSRETVVENVTKAYYGVLVNEERLALLDRNVGRLDSLLKETEAMLEQGFVEKVDVSRLRVNRNNLRTEYEKLRSLIAVSYDLLKFQMGLPIEEPLRLESSLATLAVDDMQDTPDSVSYANRLDYAINQVNQELAELDLKNVQAGYLPSLRASANFGVNGGAERLFPNDTVPGLVNSEWFGFASVGLSLSIPIFDGLLKRNQAQEKRLQQEQLRQQERLLENSIALELKQSRTNLANALATLESQRENMELAQEVFDVVTRKYQAGVGSNLEVIEADTSLKEAQTNYYAAVYDALIAQVDLQKALGLLNY